MCGGYQLLGHSYTLGERTIEGVGLLDVRTVREPGPRLIGNVAIEVVRSAATSRDRGCWRGSRITAGAPTSAQAAPLGRVLNGHGNDGRSGHEGARQGTTIGTYLHGPLLPKNTWFADWLIATALNLDQSELRRSTTAWSSEAHRSARARRGGLSRGAAALARPRCAQSRPSLSRRLPRREEMRSAVETRCGPSASASSSTGYHLGAGGQVDRGRISPASSNTGAAIATLPCTSSCPRPRTLPRRIWLSSRAAALLTIVFGPDA